MLQNFHQRRELIKQPTKEDRRLPLAILSTVTDLKHALKCTQKQQLD